MRRNDSLKSLTVLLRSSGSITKMLKKDMFSYGLNPTEFTALEVLYNLGEQPIQAIGKKVLLSSSSITYVIDQLETKNLVVRKKSEKDRRVTLISLSDEGFELMEKIFPQHSNVIEKLFEELSDEELVNLREMLKKIGYRSVELYDLEE